MAARPLLSLVAAAVLLLTACGGDDPGLADPPDDGDGTTDEATDPGDFDRDAAEAGARALLGIPEDEIEEDAETRIMRRGDEEMVGTMDLRPGRRNLELDDDGTGTYVVTRVVVEVPDGEDPLVVE